MVGRRLDKMYWYDWLLDIFVWNLMGGFSLVMACCFSSGGAIDMADGWEFVNPIHVHKYNNVNWFGAFFVLLVLYVIGSTNCAPSEGNKNGSFKTRLQSYKRKGAPSALHERGKKASKRSL